MSAGPVLFGSELVVGLGLGLLAGNDPSQAGLMQLVGALPNPAGAGIKGARSCTPLDVILGDLSRHQRKHRRRLPLSGPPALGGRPQNGQKKVNATAGEPQAAVARGM